MASVFNFQMDLAKRISKAKVNYKKSPKERITREYVEGRLELLEQLWSEFLNAHKEIMRSTEPAILKESDYSKDDIYDQTEDKYSDYKCELRTTLTRLTADQPSASINASDASCSSKSLEIKLPKINIATYSGKYSEWATFRDLFGALIHANKNLSRVQKLHYLKGYLTGEAEQYLRHIPIADENYERCWKLLEERYNNKKYICHHTLNKLFSQRNIMNESASDLKELIDTTNDCLASLSNLGIDVTSWDVIVIHILTLRLDPESRRQWEFNISSNNSSDLPTYNQFKDFLTNRYRAIEFLDAGTSLGRRGQTHNNSSTHKHKSLHVAQINCPFCSQDHKLAFCKKFAKTPVDSRRNFVETNKICFNCLGSNHTAKFCRTNVKCRVCQRKHHSLLHPQSNGSSEAIDANRGNEVSNEVIVPSSEQRRDPLVSCFSSGRVCNQALLATALVKVMTKKGDYTVRALLDQGSQCSFITESTVQFLGLKKSPVVGHISGLGGQESMSKGIVNFEIQSRVEPNYVLKIEAYVLKSITAHLPASKIKPECFMELNDLVLADPEYHTPNRIDLLLGVGIYNEILLEGLKRGPQGTPLAQATRFGWVLSGDINKQLQLPRNINVLHCRLNDNELLKKFWELEAESEPLKEKMFTEDERRCEDFFSKTTERDSEGRYVVRLPLKSDNPQVTNSLKIAEKRFLSLEYQLGKNQELKKKYIEVMNEYISLNHMELVPKEQIKNSAIYLPHHAVIRDDKDTTKLRIVFDASCKGRNNLSLNDNLLIGPTLQSDLRHLVMRWRVPPICLTADMAKMYRQVKVNKLDVDYQRILWRDSSASEIKHYRLLRVTFGTASAPYLAVKTLQQLAVDDGDQYPLAAEKVVTDYYMDGLLTGCETKEEGLRLFKEMNGLMAKGGFELMKWTSNSKELIQEMEEEGGSREVQEGLKIKSDETIKIVGLTWNRTDDSFRYTVKVPLLEEPVTKRRIISDISRFYDPLGWSGPSIIKSKIIIQKLWLAGIDWDEAVPDNLLKECLTYREELRHLAEVNIPRWIHTKADDRLVELHGFSDASKMAYAAVVYIRVIDSNGRVHVFLLSAKTKVAPVKQVSIPRLELCGAVLLTRLITEIAKVLKIDNDKIHAWTDSTVVLAWINSHPNRWKVFVANRVSEILTNSDAHHWSHVTSKENPADAASRGLHPSEFIADTMWFNGPQFLREDEINYEKPKNVTTELERVKVHCAVLESAIWDRFSSLTRMVRVVTYMRRFINNCIFNQSKLYGYLSTQELKDTMNLSIKQCQEFYFKKEIEIIEQNGTLPKSSGLRTLNPFLDESHILRVGGRLEHSRLKEAQKHPILLPKNCSLTNLVISDAHIQTLHGGPQLMLCYLQAKYWILGGKQLVRSCFRKCVTCVKNAAVPQSQLMGQLPSPRVTPTRAFKCSGVDFAGPIQIRTAKGRGHRSHKGYVCLFVCMATRAIHLEVVTDLTTEGFLQAFKRFVARRGPCTDIWSDNATNFTGAASELKRLFSKEQGSMLQEVAEALATNNCTWHFIPAQAPNFGGLWEAGVRSVKYHLKRVIGQSTLTFEEMSTVLTQVEACLNSRPLSAIMNSSDDVPILTPGHFLIGEPLIVPPDQNYESCNVGSLRRWQYTQKMVQDLWRRWSQEYLTKFFHRYKWSTLQTQPTVGDVVVVREDNLPVCRWLYGRVIATHPGSDNLVRVVTLKTKNGTIKRPISKLCLLPTAE